MLARKPCLAKTIFSTNVQLLLSVDSFITNRAFSCKNKNIHLSSSSYDKVNERLSDLRVKGKEIKINQHYFESPVQQPKPPKGQRRVADLTGLKGIFFSKLVIFIRFALITL